MRDHTSADVERHDERLFAAFLDWWWFGRIDGDPTPMHPPSPEEAQTVMDDFKSMLAHLNDHGYSIVRGDR